MGIILPLFKHTWSVALLFRLVHIQRFTLNNLWTRDNIKHVCIYFSCYLVYGLCLNAKLSGHQFCKRQLDRCTELLHQIHQHNHPTTSHDFNTSHDFSESAQYCCRLTRWEPRYDFLTIQCRHKPYSITILYQVKGKRWMLTQSVCLALQTNRIHCAGTSYQAN